MHSAAKTCAYWLLTALPAALALVYSGTFAPAFSTPKNALLLIAVALLLAWALVSKARWQPQPDERAFWALAAALVAVTLVSAAAAPHRLITVAATLHTVCGTALAVAIVLMLRGESPEKNWHRVQLSIALAAAVVALVTIAEFFTNPAAGRMRLHATLGNPDFVATWLAATLPTLLVLARQTTRWRWLWLASALLVAVALLLTGSRGGLLAMSAGLSVVALLTSKRWPIRIAVLSAIAALCLLACAAALNPRSTGESLRGRLFIWQVTLGNGAAAKPLGTGPGSFAATYPAQLGRYFTAAEHASPGRASLLHFAHREEHAQNDFVELWHDSGWLGLAAFLALIVAWFQLALRRLHAAAAPARANAIASVSTVVALLAAALVDFPLHRAETWALLWLMLAAPLLQTTPAQLQPSSPWLRRTVTVLILSLGAAAAVAPLASSFWLAQGIAAEDSDHLLTAQAAYAAALYWDPSSADANFSLVRVLALEGNYAAAMEQSHKAERVIDEPEFYLLRARILANAGQPAAAQQLAEQALARFPYSQELQEEVADYTKDAHQEPNR